jgi:hypothetical protein
MSDFKFNLCRSKSPKYYYWQESLEISLRRFRKFNSKYIEGIKICAPDISAARYKNLKFVSRGGDIGRANFDAFYIFTIEFSKSPERNFQTIYKIMYKLSTSLLDNITVKRRDNF